MSKNNLTFESDQSLSQAMKSANKNVQYLQAKVEPTSCNAVKAGGSAGKRGHSQSKTEKNYNHCKGKRADCNFKKENVTRGMTAHATQVCCKKRESTAERKINYSEKVDNASQRREK